MNTTWMISLLALTVSNASGSKTCTEQVDLIELNHFHDCLGRHVYDQVIFYEWSDAYQEYHVRAWCLVEDKEPASRRPTRSYTNEQYTVRWRDRDQNLDRCISSRHFRESWTQIDPERMNKKLLDERNRLALVKRKLELPPAPTRDVREPSSNAAVDANLAQTPPSDRDPLVR